MRHHRGGGHTGPNCEDAPWIVSLNELDAQANSRQRLEGGRFAKPSPRSRDAFLLARGRRHPDGEHASEHTAPDESLCGAKVEKREATKRCESAYSIKNHDFGDKLCVIEDNGAPDEAGALFWQREGGVNNSCGGQHLGAVISWRVKNINLKPRQRAWASARHPQLVRRR